MELKTLLQNDDRAVSPVIGVILMVAITVILAAVIGTFVLGLGDDINSEVNAGVSVDQDAQNDRITVTWTSKGNAQGIALVHNNINTSHNSMNATSVGESITVDGDSDGLTGTIDEGDTINVIAYTGADNPDDATERTVVRSITANFQIEQN